ncbi:MAG TPA: CHAT domain-containing tetratricopeptide repeat protein, partial [Thermoanaerobaculia bacterium]|nr:CHAT domain-containing tetratricopeptide repeat protein [Thermoanaerobaculia bacterium]
QAKEQHRYPVSLEEGEFLRVVVDQNGIDVAVELLGPDGKVVFAVDSYNDANGDEDFAALASGAGLYQIQVRALEDGVPPGAYTLRVEGPRPPRDRDRARLEAVQAMRAAFMDPSIERSEQALALWKHLGERRRQAEMLLFLGRQRNNQGDLARAREHALEAAGLWKELRDPGPGDVGGQVKALLDAGRAARKLGLLEEAQARFQEALAVARTSGNQIQEAIVLSNLGLLYTDMGEPHKGLEPLTAALELARRRGDRDSQFIALNNIGYAYDRLADTQRALRSYEEALSVARTLGSPREEGIALNNLCDTYRSLGDWEKARGLCLQALDLIRKLGDTANEARILNNLGIVAKRQLRLEEALALYDQSLELARGSGDVEAQITSLNNLAFLYLRLNQLDKALEHCRDAMALTGGRKATEIDSRYILGDIYRKQGILQAAREEFEKALELSRAWGDRSREGHTLLALARVEREAGDVEGALARAESVLDVVESLRSRVQDQNLRALFLAANQGEYEFAIDTAMALHRANPASGYLAKALQISERARARSLLEILSESGVDIRQGANPALLEREHNLRAELGQREMHRLSVLSSEDPERLAEAERRIEETLEKYRAVQEDLRASSPRYAALTQPRPLDLREIRTQVLDGQAILLEYSLGRERSYVWAVTPDSIQGFELPGRVRIEEAVSTYYGMLTARNQHLPSESVPVYRRRVTEADAQVRKAAEELSKLILAPVEGLLGNGPVLVVADGALQYVPFAALPLPSSGIPLIRRQEVVSLPSASALAVLRQEARERGRAPRMLAVLADPVFREDDDRLPRQRAGRAPQVPAAPPFMPRRDFSLSLAQGRQTEASPMRLPRLFSSENEAKAITALVPADQRFVALGFAASRETATSGRLGQYRMVHFATHGLLRSDHPELSSLVLSLYDEQGRPRDGFLRLSDIYNLELKADLVVLSACQTALGKEIRGEGLVGLTRGFMYAGAERVLASLWSVEDRATAELMKRFYHALLVEKLRPAAALRQAQLDMAGSARWSSPYYWAGFSLQGEWK